MYNYTFNNYLDVWVDLYGTSNGPINLSGTSSLEVHVNGEYYSDIELSSYEYGWYYESFYDINTFGYSYTELDSAAYCGDITVEIVWPNAPEGCSSVIYSDVVNLGTDPEEYGYDCLGNCINDLDGDGVCDEFEVVGCQDIQACNYDWSATDSD